MMTTHFEPHQLMSYLGHNLEVRKNDTSDKVTISGYTKTKGFMYGLAENKISNFTPLLMSIPGAVNDCDGIIPLIRFFGIAIDYDIYQDGKPRPELQIAAHTHIPGNHQAVLQTTYADDDTKLTFTLTENRGFCLYTTTPKEGVRITPVHNQEMLWQEAYKYHLWTGDQTVFAKGMAIDKSKLSVPVMQVKK